MRELVPIAVVLLLALGGCERWELDAQMEDLCKKDGGLRVYETVTLPAAMFDQNGDPFPGWRQRPEQARLGKDYLLAEETAYLRNGNPLKGEGQLRRTHWKVIRRSDGKVLGEGTRYGRSGGDFIVLGHFSSKACPTDLAAAGVVVRAVFNKGAS